MSARAAVAPLPPFLWWGGGVGGGGQMPRKSDDRISRARELRRNPTDYERKLWQHLRSLPIHTAHFRRQATIGPYFADFACHATRVVIEVDGGQHANSVSDQIRTTYLNENGYRVLRFWNNEVLGNIDGVLEVILSALEAPPTPDPSPPQERGEGSSSASSPPPILHGGEGSGVGGDHREISRSSDDR